MEILINLILLNKTFLQKSMTFVNKQYYFNLFVWFFINKLNFFLLKIVYSFINENFQKKGGLGKKGVIYWIVCEIKRI